MRRGKSRRWFGWSTHTRAAQADNSQGLQDASSADDPGKAQKQDDPQNILEAGEVDTHEGPHLRALYMGVGWIGEGDEMGEKRQSRLWAIKKQKGRFKAWENARKGRDI